MAALITVPVLLTGHRMSRLEGGAFVAAYLGYLVWVARVGVVVVPPLDDHFDLDRDGDGVACDS